ncbi:MAG: ABC transporter ATP-binding protein [Chloroflexi bacterium]|nr:ABC transporter ATP-binding protein [Chloroflexota bacterium]
MAVVTGFDLKGAVSDNRVASIWKLATGYRNVYAWATFAMGLAAVFKALTYLLLRYFVDNVLIGGQLTQTVFIIALGFVGLALLEGSFTFFSRSSAARVAENLARNLRDYVYDHLMRLTYTYHDKSQTGELIQRSTSDVDAVRRFFSDQAIMAGRIVLLFVVNFIALVYLYWPLALASVVVVPIVVVLSVYFFGRVSDAYEHFQDQEAVLSTTLQENLSGIRVVKAFARHDYETDKFEGDNWEQFERGKRLLSLHSVFWPISDILCGIQLVGGFFLGALLAINGTITVGTYLAYAGMVIWLIWPMRNLGRLIVDMSVGLVSLQRVLDLIRVDKEDLETGSHAPAEGVAGGIRVENLTFWYEEGHPVLQDISFEVKPGEVVALLGSTGSGKSSLVNLLPRFYDYQEGHIYLDGVEITEYPRHYLRKQIGIVEQEPFLFSRTIRENIAFGVGRHVTDEEVHAAARAAALHDVIESFPEGYNTLVGERGVTLSGGQKQRVAVARTLLKDPRILILDDATSSVDTETESAIREALGRLMEQRTTFIIAHRIQSVMIADLILVMDKGRIVQRGTHDELMQVDGIYRRIYSMQARIETDLEKELQGV